MTLYNTVRSGYLAGLCLLPCREDGTKAPDVSSWREYQTRRPTVDEIRAFNYAGRAGYGVVAGIGSGRVECWDFDHPSTFEAFVAAARTCGLGAVVDRIRAGYEDQTPAGGRRWICRYPEGLEWRDTTLARRPGRDGEPKIKTLIELPTFAILAPSNGATHPSGKPYVRVSGDFTTIACYTDSEREALIELGRSFDQMPRRETAPPKATGAASGTRPGDAYNRRATWPEILEPAGWTVVYTRDDVTFWRRPGKTFGISATTNVHGSDLFYPFTSSTEFEPDRSYTKFGVFAVLHHGGDFSRAAAALAEPRTGGAPRPQEPAWAHAAVTEGLGQCVLGPLLKRPYSGWFARGAVHLIAGSSGAGKTTLMLDLLRTQIRGAPFLGHAGSRSDFLVLFADRGIVSNRETLQRMKIDPAMLPLAHLPPTSNGLEALDAVRTAVEQQPELPAAVFLEGADLLVEDPCKTPIVNLFVTGLRLLAEQYSLAIVCSIGAPKSRPKDQYQLKRDQVFGSQAWSRLSNTVLVLSLTGDGTAPTRDLSVLHRNAPAEIFHLTFADGLLIEAPASEATDPDCMTWFRDVEVFTKQKFREAFALSGARAGQLLEGYVAIGVLREKQKGDRTHYVYRRPSAPKPDPGTVETDGQSDLKSDTFHGQVRTEQSVRKTYGHGHKNGGAAGEIARDLAPMDLLSLIPPKTVSVVQDGHISEEQTDNGHEIRGYTRAREAAARSARGGDADPCAHISGQGADDDAPAWVTAPAAPDDSDPIGARDMDPRGPWAGIEQPPGSAEAAARAAAVLAERAAQRHAKPRRRPGRADRKVQP